VFSSTPAGAVIKNAGTTQAALVENIDETTGALSTLTMDAALQAAIADNDYIFAGDQAGVSSQNGGVDREIAGLLAAVDNGGILATYNNVARAGNRQFNARVIDASVAPYNGKLTEDLLTIADAITSTSTSKIDALVMSPHAPIGYWQSLKVNRVLNDPRNYTGGKGSLTISLGDRTLPFRTARKLPPQVAFGLNTSTWRRFTLGTWQWVARGGSIWNLVTDASAGRMRTSRSARCTSSSRASCRAGTSASTACCASSTTSARRDGTGSSRIRIPRGRRRRSSSSPICARSTRRSNSCTRARPAGGSGR
jgi:hypothetical protein